MFESGRVSAELKEGGIEAARSDTVTAQQAVQGVPAQQLPGHPELLDGERDAATDIENWGAALGAACSGMSFSGGVTWCARRPPRSSSADREVFGRWTERPADGAR